MMPDLDALLHAVRLAAYRAAANGATPTQVRQAAGEGAALAQWEVGT